MPVERRGWANRAMISLVNWQQEEPIGCVTGGISYWMAQAALRETVTHGSASARDAIPWGDSAAASDGPPFRNPFSTPFFHFWPHFFPVPIRLQCRTK
jgi:hypothetical protein